MMLSTDDKFILEHLCKAPEYNLAINTNKELPEIDPETTKSAYLDALAAICATQFFEDIPGIAKERILFGSENTFEVWNLIPHRVLIPEDVEFLKRDRSRVEAIAQKITWLFDSWLDSRILTQKLPVNSWDDALDVLERYNYEFDFINIHSRPHRVRAETRTAPSGKVTDYWAVYPPCLTIDFIKTRYLNGGYIVDDYNSLYKFNLEAWMGLPLLRNQATGEAVTLKDCQENENHS